MKAIDVVYAVTWKVLCLKSLGDRRSLCIVGGDDAVIHFCIVLFDKRHNDIDFFSIL